MHAFSNDTSKTSLDQTDIWNRTFGGSDQEKGASVQQTGDGGYIIAGSTYGTSSQVDGDNDIWIIKTDANGNKLWDRTFGGPADDLANCIQQTSDGGYIIAGNTESQGARGSDISLIKTDGRGNKLWDRTFGGFDSNHGWSVVQTRDGGYIIGGNTLSQRPEVDGIWLIKTDANGNKLWDRTFGGPAYDYGGNVQQTSDGGYIIAGSTDSQGAGGRDDIWLIKTDANGNKLWDRTFGGPADDFGTDVRQTSNGGYIIVGRTDSQGAGGWDVWMIKTDANGSKLWDRTFGGPAVDWSADVRQTRDGGYIIVGSTESQGAGDNDIWMIKTDANGNKLWDRTFGGPADDHGWCIEQTSDGGYIIVGQTMSIGAGGWDIWLIKTDANGNI